MSISYKRKRFYREYLKDGNGRQAAIRAGYAVNSASQQAHQMINDQEGLEYYMKLLETLNDHLMVTAEDVQNELAKLAMSDIRGIYREDGSLIPVHELDDQTAASIAGVEVVMLPGGSHVQKYKFHSKQAALDNLSKQFNLMEKHQEAGTGDIHITIDDKDAKA